jgi:hypothetical protein
MDADLYPTFLGFQRIDLETEEMQKQRMYRTLIFLKRRSRGALVVLRLIAKLLWVSETTYNGVVL